jgi:hypothetical protein
VRCRPSWPCKVVQHAHLHAVCYAREHPNPSMTLARWRSSLPLRRSSLVSSSAHGTQTPSLAVSRVAGPSHASLDVPSTPGLPPTPLPLSPARSFRSQSLCTPHSAHPVPLSLHRSGSSREYHSHADPAASVAEGVADGELPTCASSASMLARHRLSEKGSGCIGKKRRARR